MMSDFWGAFLTYLPYLPKAWSRWPSSLEWWSIMSVLKCASSSRSNPFVTYVKERLLPSTKKHINRVMGYRVCQLILSTVRAPL